MTLGLDAAHSLAVQRITNPRSGRTFDITPATDFSITIGSQRTTLSATGSLSFLNADVQAVANGVQLTFRFQSRSPRMQISRVYVCYAGAPVVETWTRIASAGDTFDVADLVAWQLAIPPGHVKWVTGQRGDVEEYDQAAAFRVEASDPEPGERIELSAVRRSSEHFVPFVTVDEGSDVFFGGLMWSGGWQIALDRTDTRLRVEAAFPSVTTTVAPARSLDIPHAFFGVAPSEDGDVPEALRTLIVDGVRGGRPLTPLVTYNTWFAYGTRFDEQSVMAEIDRAASLGVDLVVVDAGWWIGAGEEDDYDFSSGLGSWAVDADRFPSGLASLVDYAHTLGVKFGLWVEPERVALSTVDGDGLVRESWLATRSGDYGALSNAQICLARPEARQWVLDRVVDLLDTVRPDYLKWDNNFAINCDREGHGHGKSDGNLAHVQSLYSILDEIRARYPDLLIENVSGGGNRLDFGMMAYTDVAWMDDHTSPSSLVRHNLEGLINAFPPAYLMSFFIDSGEEPIHGAEDLASIVRSRMPGVLGLTYRSQDIDDDLAAGLALEIARYKTYRDTLSMASGTLLTAQAPVDDDSWDIMQQVADDGRTAMVFAFKMTPDEGRVAVRLRNLSAESTYSVYSMDAGALGDASGESLMADGIELSHTVASASKAHILLLTVKD